MTTPIFTTRSEADRAAWIEGMRSLCDLLAADPEVPLPHEAHWPMSLYITEQDEAALTVAERVARVAQHMTGDPTTWPGFHFDIRLEGVFAGAPLRVFARSCEAGLDAIRAATEDLSGVINR